LSIAEGMLTGSRS